MSIVLLSYQNNEFVVFFFFFDMSYFQSMGSVLAAASPSPTPAAAAGGQGVPGLVSVPPGFTMPPVSSIPPSAESGQEAADAESSLPNPGTYEECHRKCKGETSSFEMLISFSGKLCCLIFISVDTCC